MYKLLYLPSKDQTFTDNCDVIDDAGEHFPWNEKLPMQPFRVAEPFIVDMQFNQMVIIGKPSAEAMVFLKNGSDIKECDVKPGVYRKSLRLFINYDIQHYKDTIDVFPDPDIEIMYKIRCPTCQVWH